MPSGVAQAKVNLYLHVGAAGADGRHPVSSLAVFADVGDGVRVERAETGSLTVTGPFADALDGGGDNLITRALALAGAEPLAVTLDKRLPVASGLGGGTSDAGMVLRLAQALDPALDDARVEAAARALGADGLLCLKAETLLSEGEGEILSPAPTLPVLHAVLVNPGVPSPTGAVYRAYDEGPGAFSAERPSLPDRIADLDEVIALLEQTRNDLEAPAVRLEPVIGEALAQVRAAPGVRFARMSGSGATVFGLCETAEAAERAGADIARNRPNWWVVATRFK